ncbi:MAG: mechanosensitive ion channel protein MscS [Alphaproteobacteria bacterium]|nr:mechanosensitive ion channel protein MscS [Alphaproteobacteria bacterium]
MKPMHKRLIAGTAIAALLAVPLATSAQARDYRGGYRGGYHHHGGNTGAYVGLGLGALALGSILAYSATQPAYVAPPAYYAPPPPAYYAPPPAYSYYAPPPGAYYDPYTDSYKTYPSYDRGSN